MYIIHYFALLLIESRDVCAQTNTQVNTSKTSSSEKGTDICSVYIVHK